MDVRAATAFTATSAMVGWTLLSLNPVVGAVAGGCAYLTGKVTEYVASKLMTFDRDPSKRCEDCKNACHAWDHAGRFLGGFAVSSLALRALGFAALPLNSHVLLVATTCCFVSHVFKFNWLAEAAVAAGATALAGWAFAILTPATCALIGGVGALTFLAVERIARRHLSETAAAIVPPTVWFSVRLLFYRLSPLSPLTLPLGASLLLAAAPIVSIYAYRGIRMLIGGNRGSLQAAGSSEVGYGSGRGDSATAPDYDMPDNFPYPHGDTAVRGGGGGGSAAAAVADGSGGGAAAALDDASDGDAVYYRRRAAGGGGGGIAAAVAYPMTRAAAVPFESVVCTPFRPDHGSDDDASSGLGGGRVRPAQPDDPIARFGSLSLGLGLGRSRTTAAAVASDHSIAAPTGQSAPGAYLNAAPF